MYEVPRHIYRVRLRVAKSHFVNARPTDSLILLYDQCIISLAIAAELGVGIFDTLTDAPVGLD